MFLAGDGTSSGTWRCSSCVQGGAQQDPPRAEERAEEPRPQELPEAEETPVRTGPLPGQLSACSPAAWPLLRVGLPQPPNCGPASAWPQQFDFI